MARDNALKWSIYIALYFLVFTVIMTVISNVASDYSLDTSNYTTSGGSTSLSDQSFCSTPRYDDNTDNSDLTSQSLLQKGYISDEASCQAYAGLTWTNESTFFFGLFTSSASCDGIINHSVYNNGTTLPTSWGGRVLGTGILNSTPLSELYNLSTNRIICEQFGFKWSTPDLRADFNGDSLGGAWGVIVDIVSFRLNFFTGSAFLDGLLTLILIWLPLIWLIGNIYVLIR